MDETNRQNILHAPHRTQAESGVFKRPKRSAPALELYALVRKIIALSPDSSCFASTANLARHLHRRKSDVKAAKHELIAGGWLDLSLRPNGLRRNPRHRLTLPAPKKKDRACLNAFLRSRGPCNVSQGPLMALDLWSVMPRLDLIDCYIKSGLNITPVRGKVPNVPRETFSRKSREDKIDTFWRDPDLNVGVWLDLNRTVFDFDSARPVDQFDTLISSSRKGQRHHLYFQGNPEIYNTSKQVARDIDTKAVGGLLILPPSFHPETGDPYVWELLRAPSIIPDELLELWNNRKTNGLVTGFRLGDLPDEILKGERDNTIWSYGRRLRACGVPFDELEARLRIINQERCRPAFSDRYMTMKINHIWQHRNDPEKFTERTQNA